ncbi:hypothetical protein [Eupransor demetentiae]|uniref:Uncharacterized protein n=1 Tax=Eupransor demetentiae TaxID=3109584 RepID=A0ABM9N4G0_9LACO|nr:hypothetical protein R54876_GBNLAHCA_00616 [Lactobacillaceae bacterium LMG 33000]
MKDTIMAIRPVNQKGQAGTLVVDTKAKKSYFTPEELPASKAHVWLLWCLIISGILVTPYWLFQGFLHLPRLIVHNTALWWLILFLTAGVPLLAWLFGQPKVNFDHAKLEPLTLDKWELRNSLRTWLFERAWVAFVLILLPPTTVMFLVFYIIKADALDALLITVHGSLFLRRLIPHALQRIRVSTKQIIDWR